MTYIRGLHYLLNISQGVDAFATYGGGELSGRNTYPKKGKAEKKIPPSEGEQPLWA